MGGAWLEQDRQLSNPVAVDSTEHVPYSRTLGIDLASQPKDTAACRIEWRNDGPGRVLDISDRMTDAALLELVGDPTVTRVGIDAPFGWPLEFVDALVAYRDNGDWPVPPDDPERFQRSLVLRETDREVLRATGEVAAGDSERRGKQPMSVTTSWLAFPAMRCARLLAEVRRRQGHAVDRSGQERFVEVYPDAALREWGLSPAEWSEGAGGYKGGEPAAVERRTRLVDDVVRELDGWLDVDPELVDGCRRDDDFLDALVSALVARAAELGRTRSPPINLARATQEGWIHLPVRGRLAALAD